MKNPLLQDTGPIWDKDPIRVLRGGSWINFAGYSRVSFRGRSDASNRGINQGFRLFRSKR